MALITIWMSTFRSAVISFLTFAILIAYIIYTTHSPSSHVRGSPIVSVQRQSASSHQLILNDHESVPWSFDAARDARNHALSDEQCDVALPEYWHEIERAKKFWHDRGGIKESDLDMEWQKDSGMMRLEIIDQQLIIISKKYAVPAYDVTRALSLLHSIHRAIITSPAPIPNIEFTINLGDWPADPSNEHPVWVLSRAASDTSKWVMPDFGYWSWPLDVLGEYNEVRSRIGKIEEASGGWSGKVDKAVWRGATATNGLREVLVKVSEGKKWSDIKAIEWKDGRPVVGDGTGKGMEGRALSIPEHCRYKFVVHTEGHSYSGRGKYLLNCNSVSITHTQEWIEPHSHLYISEPGHPSQNIIQVNRSFTDLDSVVQNLLANDTEAKRIATNSVNTFRDRYLTPAAQTCYWRRMMRTWAEISKFKVKPFVGEVPRGDGEEPQRRGISYESFVADLRDPSTL